MSHYRRAYINGGMYFFTLVTYKRKPLLCSPKSIIRLRESFRYIIKKYPFEITGIVILPDHMHCILQMPPNDFNFSIRWNHFKRYYSIGMNSPSNQRREKMIWQRRYWEHLIRDENDFQNHMDYIHCNPVKHGYVSKPFEWEYSSFRREVHSGTYNKDWGELLEPDHIQNLKFE